MESIGRVSQLTSLFPPTFVSPLASAVCDVKAARCEFECLCLCVSVCVLSGGVTAECVALFPTALCLTYNEFVKQSVRITATVKGFIRDQILVMSYPFFFSHVLFSVPSKQFTFLIVIICLAIFCTVLF